MSVGCVWPEGCIRVYEAQEFQFKAEAVQLVIESGRPIAELARELQINDGTLGNWVGKYRAEYTESAKALSPIDAARLAEIEEENRRLRMENEFLEKAAAVFAKTHS